MKVRLVVLCAFVVCLAGALAAVAFRGSTRAPAAPSVAARAPTAIPTFTRAQAARRFLPSTWIRGLRASNSGHSMLIACFDRNHDGHINRDDSPEYATLDISIASSWLLCAGESAYGDLYDGPPSDPSRYGCDATRRPLLIVAIGGAGTDMLNAPEGESLGVLDIVNQLQARAMESGIASAPMLVASAIWGAEPAQTSMERWLENQIAHRLDAMPCLRVALIGHSHGGVTVSSVTHVLDQKYADRMFGVMVDRSTVLYDRWATDWPHRTPLLNVYQLNEGWHGVALGFPNVVDVDDSAEVAPVAPSDGGGPPARVTHKTLDDSPGAQRVIVDAIMAWATR